jgi:hypothetical protein
MAKRSAVVRRIMTEGQHLSVFVILLRALERHEADHGGADIRDVFQLAGSARTLRDILGGKLRDPGSAEDLMPRVRRLAAAAEGRYATAMARAATDPR